MSATTVIYKSKRETASAIDLANSIINRRLLSGNYRIGKHTQVKLMLFFTRAISTYVDKPSGFELSEALATKGNYLRNSYLPSDKQAGKVLIDTAAELRECYAF